MVKFVTRITFFIVALAAILLVVRRFDSYDDVEIVNEKMQGYLAQRDSIDVLFLGSSRFHRHIDPPLFDSVLASRGYRVNSFNLGVPGMWMLERLFLAEAVIEEASPRLDWLFIEVEALRVEVYPANLGSRRGIYHHDTPRLIWAVRTIWDSDRTSRRVKLFQFRDRTKMWLQNQFVLGRGPEILERAGNRAMGKELVPTDSCGTDRGRPIGVAGVEADGPPVRYTGYMPLEAETDCLSIVERRAFFLSEEGQQKYKRYLNRLHRGLEGKLPEDAGQSRQTVAAIEELVAHARSKEIRVALVVPVGSDWEGGVVRRLREVLPDVPVLELNNPVRYPEFYEVSSRFDEQHLKQDAAAEATRVLADLFVRATTGKQSARARVARDQR